MRPLQPALLAVPLLCQAFARASDAPAPAVHRELLRLPSLKEATLPCLLLSASPTPRAVAILFPGGPGVVGLGRRPVDAILGPRGNFLVRSASLLVSPELAVAIVDCPSDAATGMNDEFRMSGRHAADIRSLGTALRARFPGVKVFLAGTSRGTVSAAYVAEALGAEVDGVVLTSSVFHSNTQHPGLARFRFEDLRAPLLLVHHAEDGCPVCPYSTALKLAGRGAALVTVRGGAAPESGPCDPLSNHGYFGREAEVARAIRAWMLGGPFERDIP